MYRRCGRVIRTLVRSAAALPLAYTRLAAAPAASRMSGSRARISPPICSLARLKSGRLNRLPIWIHAVGGTCRKNHRDVSCRVFLERLGAGAVGAAGLSKLFQRRECDRFVSRRFSFQGLITPILCRNQGEPPSQPSTTGRTPSMCCSTNSPTQSPAALARNKSSRSRPFRYSSS